jgi:hypothetical protein
VDEFVSSEGDTIDSGRRRPPEDVELDQNGELLSALGTYVDWTGDLALVEKRWEKIRTIAEFPLSPAFLHAPSGLLHNRREYWERHKGHGIEVGFELMSQFFVSVGLRTAARLADALGHATDGERWTAAADRLQAATLEDPPFRLVEHDRLIKRRGLDGVWQRTLRMPSDGGLPQGIPLLQEGDHFLDPDASSALPIAYGFVDPRGPLATNTLAHVEELWNQWWEGGGYGRYHATGEPDSPGAWPFASLFVARAYAEVGDDSKVWRILRWMAGTVGGTSGAWMENDGPRISPPYPQVGFTPWTWAEMITLVVHHLMGVRPDPKGVTIRPRILKGLSGMDADLMVRGHRIRVRARPGGPGEQPGGWIEEAGGGPRLPVPGGPEGFRIPHPSADIRIELSC